MLDIEYVEILTIARFQFEAHTLLRSRLALFRFLPKVYTLRCTSTHLFCLAQREQSDMGRWISVRGDFGNGTDVVHLGRGIKGRRLGGLVQQVVQPKRFKLKYILSFTEKFAVGVENSSFRSEQKE